MSVASKEGLIQPFYLIIPSGQTTCVVWLSLAGHFPNCNGMFALATNMLGPPLIPPCGITSTTVPVITMVKFMILFVNAVVNRDFMSTHILMGARS